MTVPIGKKTEGGALGYYWDHDGAVVDATDEDAVTLLHISGGLFYEIQPPEVSEVAKPLVTSEVAPVDPPESPFPGSDISEAIEVAQVVRTKKG